jgi:hypothetical protein
MLILDGHLLKLISEFRIFVFFNVVFIMVLQYFLFHFFLLLNTLLQGRFEILNLSGSFMPTENQGTRSRAGGMSVSLARTDGRVVGGGVAGVLIAASPVQVVVGSFLPNGNQDPKLKKPKSDYAAATFTQAIVVSSAPPPPPQTNNAEKEDSIGGGGHVLQNSGNVNSNFTSQPSAFRRDNSWANMQSLPDTRKSATDINISLPDS